MVLMELEFVDMLTYRVYALTSVISYSMGDSRVCGSAWLERAHRAKFRNRGNEVGRSGGGVSMISRVGYLLR